MVEDSTSEEDALKITHQLQDDFKQQLATYFRRCSELLRHFFALRRVIEMEKLNPTGEGVDRSIITKSKKIVKAMEEVAIRTNVGVVGSLNVNLFFLKITHIVFTIEIFI